MKSYLSAAVVLLLGSNVEAHGKADTFTLKKALLNRVQALEHDLKNIDSFLQSELSAPQVRSGMNGIIDMYMTKESDVLSNQIYDQLSTIG
jgi:hypothetical protein